MVLMKEEFNQNNIGFPNFKLLPSTYYIMFGDFGIYMLTRLWNLVQLSIYSTSALFPKYFVAMKYR